ncbi:MaoC family dehydratase [Methylocapsa sp. S129]|uniref:MaoC family dehydratase n=1 Tax=Methylocapsa sp. S129 TaxID=1641869 RepID=UPI00131AC777|nr:MaoC family dehydratase [Methylocapsa sp. S129]
MSLFYDDIRIGDVSTLGAHTFTREGIIAFAVLYDPQPFHLSEEGGKASMYGSLIASGWHTASVCMRLLIDWRDRARASHAALGQQLPKLGVSPGFRDMRWPAPVRAGDTVAYSSRVETMRETKRPQWGLVTSRHTGLNQHGAEVFAYTSIVLWERRAA